MNSNNNSTKPAPKSGGQGGRIMLDVMRFMIEASCGPAAVEAFNRDLLPTLRLRPEAYRELTESEYKAATAQVLKELPVYLRALLDHQF